MVTATAYGGPSPDSGLKGEKLSPSERKKQKKKEEETEKREKRSIL